MTFQGIPFDNVKVWTMASQMCGKPTAFDKFKRLYPDANILSICQYARDAYLYTTIWFVEEVTK